MMDFLKNHPFAVNAFFKQSIVLTFSVPKDELAALIPDCLELDTYNNEWAFIAMALVDTKHLRPAGMPKFLGNNFQLIGYRIFTRYRNTANKRLRGLYILKSETDKKRMEFLGNLFTHYKYSTTDITVQKVNDKLNIYSQKSNFTICLNDLKSEDIPLPTHSPFKNWKEARRFAGPLPFTFTYNSLKKEVLIIEGKREYWTPKPIEVISHGISFLDQFNFNKIVLASAFAVNNIPYRWEKGKTEPWQQ